MQLTSALESCTVSAGVGGRRPSGPESVYRSAFNSFTQRHSAEPVKKIRMTRSLCSRFADVLSLECGMSSAMTADHGLSYHTRSLVINSGQSPAVNRLTTAAASFAPMHRVTADSNGGLMLSSLSLRQLSFAADDRDALAVSGSRCNSSMNADVPLSPSRTGPRRTPGDFPSNLLLAPITAPSRPPQRRATGQHRVRWIVNIFTVATHLENLKKAENLKVVGKNGGKWKKSWIMLSCNGSV